MPLMVHSTWRAPAVMAASELATARPEVVVAVRREDDALRRRSAGMRSRTSRNICAVFFRRGVADGVGHVDGGGAGFDGHADHFDQEVAIGAGRVFGREFDVVDKGAGQAHGFGRLVERLLAAHLELVLEVQIARGEEDVDARAVGKLKGACGHLDVFFFGAGQGGDARLADGLGDGGDGREVALGGHGEAGLDDVHAQIFKSVGHGELFLRGHAAAGGLLAVAQSGVEEGNVIWIVHCVHACRGRHFLTLLVSRIGAV